MKKRTILLFALAALMLVLSGCTILTQEQVALIGTGEPEEEAAIQFAPAPGSSDPADIVISDEGTEAAPEVEIEAEPEATPEPVVEQRDLTPLPESYFDDAIFFGDAVSAALEYMDDNFGAIGNAVTLIRTNYTLGTASGVEGENRLNFRNASGGPQDIFKTLTEYNKAFFMLGMNDISAGAADKCPEYLAALVAKIRAARPDVKIYFQTITPVVSANEKNNLNNKAIDEFNEMLRKFAEENGCNVVEIGEHFKGEDGTLLREYAKPDGALLNIDSGKFWVELLKDPANYMTDPRA